MRRIVPLNKNGMTLIEVLIALLLFLVVSLAVLKTSVLTLDSNMRNSIRDEAVNIGEELMSAARNTPFDSLPSSTTTTTLTTVQRHFRNNATVTYTPVRTVTVRGTDDKQIDITLSWSWRGKTLSHTVSTIMRKPT